jgi:hypothetical protein
VESRHFVLHGHFTLHVGAVAAAPTSGSFGVASLTLRNEKVDAARGVLSGRLRELTEAYYIIHVALCGVVLGRASATEALASAVAASTPAPTALRHGIVAAAAVLAHNGVSVRMPPKRRVGEDTTTSAHISAPLPLSPTTQSMHIGSTGITWSVVADSKGGVAHNTLE